MDALDHARAELAAAYLSGNGIEIGAFGRPVQVPPSCRIQRLDKNRNEVIFKQHHAPFNPHLPEPDILDDGCILSTIPSHSLDFIIACHFLEHCQDLLGVIAAHISKLTPAGTLFYILPNKPAMFDAPRPPTTMAHLLADWKDGGASSYEQHIAEWLQLFPQADELEIRRSPEMIHFHAWSLPEQQALFAEYTDFRILTCETVGDWPEVITVLQKL
jgi:SAM-dependent methyltransferase